MPNPEHVARLKEGVEGWNQWRNENPGVRAKLAWADLVGADLRGANLMDADLSNTNLSEANLRGANLNDAKLVGANLTGARLNQAKLVYANMGKADLSEAKLTGADLTGAKLVGAKLLGANLSAAKLNDADLSDAVLLNTNLARAKLTNANLSRANLGKATLLGTNLTRAKLIDANLRDTFMSQVTAPNSCFEGAKLLRFRAAGCNLEGATCHRADFRDYDHREPKWREFGDGGFEKLYGPLFGVEVLLDPHVDMVIVRELMVWLGERWQTTRPESGIVFGQLSLKPQGYIGQFLTPRDLVETVRDCFAEQLRTLFDNQGQTQNETEVLVRQNLKGLERRLLRASVPASQLLMGKVGLTAVQDDKREQVTIEYYAAGAMKIGSVQGENVVITGKLLGTGIANVVHTAHDEASVQAAVERQLRQSEAAAEEDREVLVDEFAAAIPRDKLAFWKNTLASLVANGATAAIQYYAQQILTHLGK